MLEKFTQVGNQKVFFRMAGSGTPIVLLHASPGNSRMFIPLMEMLSEHHLVIAPDTPGYGNSQPLQMEQFEISDYATMLHLFLQKIGIQKAAIYGTATGAQIAIRYGLNYPNAVSRLYLDNTAHFTEEQRRTILKQYFPDLSPKLDGSHLKQIWIIVTSMFKYFPWFSKAPQHQLRLPEMPAAFLHQIARDFINAGTYYDKAYKAAFKHEQAAYVQQLKTPTILFDWEASIIRPYTEQLIAAGLPDNVQVITTPAAQNERLKQMIKHIASTYATAPALFLNETAINNFVLPLFNTDKFPKIVLNDDGTHLNFAWDFVKEKNGHITDVQHIHEIFREWMNASN